MAERLHPVEPAKLLPGYWDGHKNADDCPWQSETVRPPIPTNEISVVRKFAKDSVLVYLNEGSEHTLRTLADKETFDGTKFPVGTIISFGIEELTTDRNHTNRYFDISYFGVVCQYRRDGEKMRAIIPVALSSDGKAFPTLNEEPMLQVGKVIHKKSGMEEENVSERLYRTTRLSILMVNG